MASSKQISHQRNENIVQQPTKQLQAFSIEEVNKTNADRKISNMFDKINQIQLNLSRIGKEYD